MTVQDKSGKLVTDALGVYLYPGAIPDGRQTEFKQEFSSTGSWSVEVSAHDLHMGNYFISVRCGAMAASFRVVPFVVKSKLENRESIHGEVCPGGWVYHHVDTQETGSLLRANHDWTPGHPLNLMITLKLLSGDLKFTRRWEEAPIKLTPPYSEATAAEQLASHQHAIIHLCNVEVHDQVFIGLLGGHECSEYVITSAAFSDGHIKGGQDAGAPTSGFLSGTSFTPHDFSSQHEDLVVTVDGHDQTVTLTENIAQVGDAVTALTAGLNGATVSEDHGNIVVTSELIGASSTVVLAIAQSGAHAAGLFGSGSSTAGSDGSPAAPGWYQGYTFHGYDFVGHEEELVVSVDGGADQVILLSTNIVDVECAIVALAGLSGADARIEDGALKIVSQSVGRQSSVMISDRSGRNALALFVDACEEFEGSHQDVVLGAPVRKLVDGHFAFGSCSPGGLQSFGKKTRSSYLQQSSQ